MCKLDLEILGRWHYHRKRKCHGGRKKLKKVGLGARTFGQKQTCRMRNFQPVNILLSRGTYSCKINPKLKMQGFAKLQLHSLFETFKPDLRSLVGGTTTGWENVMEEEKKLKKVGLGARTFGQKQTCRMRIFQPVNKLVVTRNLWLILLIKLIVLKFS